MAIIALRRPGPRPATMARGSRISGKATRISVSRMMTGSGQVRRSHKAHSRQIGGRGGSHGEIRMMQLSQVVQSNPDILGGTPVFVGTRVPVPSIFDHLEGGDALDEFLHQFHSVTREQAIGGLDSAR